MHIKVVRKARSSCSHIELKGGGPPVLHPAGQWFYHGRQHHPHVRAERCQPLLQHALGQTLCGEGKLHKHHPRQVYQAPVLLQFKLSQALGDAPWRISITAKTKCAHNATFSRGPTYACCCRWSCPHMCTLRLSPRTHSWETHSGSNVQSPLVTLRTRDTASRQATAGGSP